MLRQIDLKTAIDLVLFEAEEVKIIRPAEKWEDSKLESLNDIMNDLDKAVFLYDVPGENEQKEAAAYPENSTEKEKTRDDATKVHIKSKKVAKTNEEPDFEPDRAGRNVEEESEIQKGERKIHELSDEEWKQIAKMRTFGASIDEIERKFGIGKAIIRAYLAEYEEKHPESVATYYRREQP